MNILIYMAKSLKKGNFVKTKKLIFCAKKQVRNFGG
jgi:hypothetical protein